jgi:hypothetical protein
VANTLKLFRNGAVGFIGWLDFFSLFHNNGRANRSAASSATSFNDDLAILFEFDGLNHAEIRFAARVAPGVFEDGLLLHCASFRKVPRNSRHRI